MQYKKTVFSIWFTVTSTDLLIIDWILFCCVGLYGMQCLDFFFCWPCVAALFWLLLMELEITFIKSSIFTHTGFPGTSDSFITWLFLHWIYWYLGTLPSSEMIIQNDFVKFEFKSSLLLSPAKNAPIRL